jgi:hypothetical protein
MLFPKEIKPMSKSSVIVRWIARITSVIIILGVLAIYIDEGGFNPLRMTGSEAIMMIFFWACVIGLAVAWKWPLIGGLISAISMVLFIVAEFIITGHPPRGVAFETMMIPGLLFVASAKMAKRR